MKLSTKLGASQKSRGRGPLRPPLRIATDEAQVQAKDNFSIWKSRVQLVFHRKPIHSHFYTFSATVIKISSLFVQNGVDEGCKLHKLFCKCSCLRCRRKFGRGTIIKSVFDHRFNSNKHTYMFLFVTKAFCVFISRIWFLVCDQGLFETTEWESCMWPWAQFGGGHGGRVSPTFSDEGIEYPMSLHFFL